MYISLNAISAQSWAIKFGEETVRTLRGWGYAALDWYDGFTKVVPSWYEKTKFQGKRSDVRCKIYPSGTARKYKYVVVLSHYEGGLLLSRHARRDTWETQGGHIEEGETPTEAARRELYEESGATDFGIRQICDYYGYDDVSGAWGAVFAADIRTLGPMPRSEMAETRVFAALPDNLTYPHVTPELFAFYGAD